MLREESNDYIDWLNQRAMRGKSFFTKDDFNGAFGNVTEGSRAVALSRLADKAPSYKEFVQNIELKMQDEEFLEDVIPLLRPEIDFEPHKAYALVYEKLIDRMPGKRD